MSRKNIIAMTGGGSGGHLTPLLAVAEQLQKIAPDYKLEYIGQQGDKLGDIINQDPPLFSGVNTVRAGKFRRYHGEGLRQLLDIKTLVLNIRDLLYVIIGSVQAFLLLRRMQPSVLFCKGGFVGVPVAFAAWILGIPYVTHDSDAIPGLANKLISKGATLHAVALPKDIYPYPSHKTITVGVPIAARFKHVTSLVNERAKQTLGIPKTAPVLLVIGGGLGAERINKAIMTGVVELLNIHSLRILHVVGRANEQRSNDYYDNTLLISDRSRVVVYGFTNQVALLGEAADVVVTRAGATNLAEFSTQAKACIIVPNPLLTGGHQIKNAHAYKQKQAAVIVSEDHLDELVTAIGMLLSDTARRELLSQNILNFATKDSAMLIANLLIVAAEKRA